MVCLSGYVARMMGGPIFGLLEGCQRPSSPNHRALAVLPLESYIYSNSPRPAHSPGYLGISHAHLGRLIPHGRGSGNPLRSHLSLSPFGYAFSLGIIVECQEPSSHNHEDQHHEQENTERQHHPSIPFHTGRHPYHHCQEQTGEFDGKNTDALVANPESQYQSYMSPSASHNKDE